MRDFLTSHTGIDMTGFFDAWVFTPGSPHFSIDSTTVLELNDGFQVDIWLKQKFKGAEFPGMDPSHQSGRATAKTKRSP